MKNAELLSETDAQIESQFEQLIIEACQEAKRLRTTGALDLDQYRGDPILLARLTGTAALKNVMAQHVTRLTSRCRADYENLLRF